MTNPLVSIIVPVYNAQKGLSRCLESICSQTYQELEIIVLNDGSTDDSLAICEQFRAKDPRIVVVDKENEGVSRTRKGRSSNRAASIVSPRKNSARLPQKIAPLSASVSTSSGPFRIVTATGKPSSASVRFKSAACALVPSMMWAISPVRRMDGIGKPPPSGNDLTFLQKFETFVSLIIGFLPRSVNRETANREKCGFCAGRFYLREKREKKE